jgi:hypothetical protein
MAIINKTGITDGGTIQAEHVTRAIDALSGVSTDTVVATGSFTGSFKGDASGLTGISVTTAATASYVLNAVSSSFAQTAQTASFALNAGAGAGFPFTGSARITGSLLVTGSFEVSRSLSVTPGETSINSNTVIMNGASSNQINGGDLSINVPTTFTNDTQVDPQYLFSARSNVENLDNSDRLVIDIENYKPGSIFIIDRRGTDFVEINLTAGGGAIYAGSQYKFILPYAGSDFVYLIGDGGSNLFGSLQDLSTKDVALFRQKDQVQLNDADVTVVDATFLGTGGNQSEWWLQIITSGSYIIT